MGNIISWPNHVVELLFYNAITVLPNENRTIIYKTKNGKFGILRSRVLKDFEWCVDKYSIVEWAFLPEEK